MEFDGAKAIFNFYIKIMPTSFEYIATVLEKVKPFGQAKTRKMFGEYLVYLDGHLVFSVCDNTVFVKKFPELKELLQDAPCGFPYDGAKEHYIVDAEDKELLEKLIPLLKTISPEKKKRFCKSK